MDQIGFIGEKLDLLIRAGASFGPYMVTLTNPNLTAVNLTGVTIRGSVKVGTVSIVLGVVITNAVAGQFTFGFTLAQTRIMVDAGASQGVSVFKWDMEMQDSAGNVIPMYYGTVRVHAENTV